jgi:2-methylfumaryl-CoA isomerase
MADGFTADELTAGGLTAGGLTAGAAPLAGMRVIEISSFVAAPLGGLTLAQLGAEVIRVDQASGAADAGRWPLAPSGTSLYWTGLNKGKRSVVLDLRSAAGRELLADLVAAPGDGGGIVLTNVSGPAWASYPELARRRPDLIHLQIRGRADGSPAVDYTVNAASGFPLATGPEELAGAVNHVFPAWDVACGLYAATGLLAAERHRRRTGAGQSLTLALEDVALVLAGHLGFLAQAQLTGAGRPRIGNHLYGGFGRDFVTRDGTRIMVVTLTARHFSDLGRVTGLSGTLAELERLLEADFSQDADRYAHREVIAALLSRWFAGHSDAEAQDALAGSAVLWSRYRSFAEVAADPALAGRPVLSLIDQPGVGRVLASGLPLVPADTGLAGTVPAAAAFGAAVPAPAMGADTAAVLSELLGLTPSQISDLAARGIAVVPAPAGPASERDPACD